MRKQLLFLIFIAGVLVIWSGNSTAQDTFSIVAVDPATGQAGSAGASCIAGSIIISDVHPGVGVIHTQSFWNAANQNYARNLMNQGFSPQQIIDSLAANDAQGNPTIRQYGVVDLAGGGRSAAYTGVNCFNYKNHILGPNYAIQGNILLGQQVLDSMETRFLNTPGSFAERMMAALQGAKMPGADTRCLSAGTSSISAFIRVARPQDTTGTYYLDLNVNNVPFGVEPIDSLQVLYDIWSSTITGSSEILNTLPGKIVLFPNYPNPFNPSTTIRYQLPTAAKVVLTIYNLLGQEVNTLVRQRQPAGYYEIEWDGRDNPGNPAPSGVYIYRIRVFASPGEGPTFIQTRKMLLLK
jgi:uncharacterized Ntn-hydrolase superfamily protein